MPSIAYGSGAYKRTDGNFPELVLINMLVEKSKTSEQGAAIISRLGLVSAFENGTGPINGLFAKKGTLSGDIFSISDATLYRAASSIGAISGTGYSSFAGGYGEILITRGSTLYSYNGTNLVPAGYLGQLSNEVIAGCFINSTFVGIEKNSSHYAWSANLDGRTWDVTHFATAEREPDRLLDVAPLQNNLWLFGENTVEVHADTSGADARFTPNEAMGYNIGIMATGCVCAADNSLFFIGSNRSVYRCAEVPELISDNSIDERILASATASLFTYQFEGHEFIAVRLDDETLAFDISTGEWCEDQSVQSNWFVSTACMVDKTAYFGSDADGKVLNLGGWDDLGSELERRFTAYTALNAPTAINNLKLWANTGATAILTGQGSDPQVEMRYSRDAGETWSEWASAPLGAAGDFRAVPQWRRLGMFDFPGAMFEFRVTDPVPFRVSAVKINDPNGGRSR